MRLGTADAMRFIRAVKLSPPSAHAERPRGGLQRPASDLDPSKHASNLDRTWPCGQSIGGRAVYRRAHDDAAVGIASGRKVPYPGRPPVWILQASRDRRLRPPWAWHAYERVRELWELERETRRRMRRLTGLMQMAQVLAFREGLGAQTWHWNEVAWAAIREHARCGDRLRDARREYRELWAEGLRLARQLPATDRMLKTIFPWWFERPPVWPQPARPLAHHACRPPCRWVALGRDDVEGICDRIDN